MTELPAQPVSRRIVFYIPGYDPIPPRRYRELYRIEGAKQAAICGYTLKVVGRNGAETYGWNAGMTSGDQHTSARIEFLKWNDIVQNSMQFNILQTYFRMFATLGYYIRTGALLRLFRLRPQPMIAALYPVFMLSSQLAVAALAGRIVRHGLTNIALLPFPLALVAGLSMTVALLMLFRKYDGRIYGYYLALDYVFSAQNGGAIPSALAPRLAEFSRRIQTAIAQGFVEVLIVGHSTGAHLAVDVAAKALKRRAAISAVVAADDRTGYSDGVVSAKSPLFAGGAPSLGAGPASDLGRRLGSGRWRLFRSQRSCQRHGG